jgi:hypothetical protein
MHREEFEQQTECAGCGTAISTSADRGYTYGSQSVLCFECALARGGIYDADQDRWVIAPEVADLPEPDVRP